jgi:hypothetical protein
MSINKVTKQKIAKNEDLEYNFMISIGYPPNPVIPEINGLNQGWNVKA